MCWSKWSRTGLKYFAFEFMSTNTPVVYMEDNWKIVEGALEMAEIAKKDVPKRTYLYPFL